MIFESSKQGTKYRKKIEPKAGSKVQSGSPAAQVQRVRTSTYSYFHAWYQLLCCNCCCCCCGLHITPYLVKVVTDGDCSTDHETRKRYCCKHTGIMEEKMIFKSRKQGTKYRKKILPKAGSKVRSGSPAAQVQRVGTNTHSYFHTWYQLLCCCCCCGLHNGDCCTDEGPRRR